MPGTVSAVSVQVSPKELGENRCGVGWGSRWFTAQKEDIASRGEEIDALGVGMPLRSQGLGRTPLSHPARSTRVLKV